MDQYTVPFDAKIGNFICPETTQLLLKLFGKDMKFFDEDAFIKGKQRKPCIASCLMVTKGGSCDFTIGKYDIDILNGTLQSIQDTETGKRISIYNYLHSYKNIMKIVKS